MLTLLDGREIKTEAIYPAIPFRGHDWVAYLEGEEEIGPVGCGATEAEAVQDLCNQIDAEQDDEEDVTVP